MTDETRERILSLRAQGWSYAAIGREVGLVARTVERTCDPEAAARDRERSREWKKQNRDHAREYNQRYKREGRRSEMPYLRFLRELDG